MSNPCYRAFVIGLWLIMSPADAADHSQGVFQDQAGEVDSLWSELLVHATPTHFRNPLGGSQAKLQAVLRGEHHGRAVSLLEQALESTAFSPAVADGAVGVATCGLGDVRLVGGCFVPATSSTQRNHSSRNPRLGTEYGTGKSETQSAACAADQTIGIDPRRVGPVAG